jgi:nucleoside-diphosphate-sugar epimerase
MNILVIGGTGLISTAITRRLQAMGHAVTHYNRGKRTAEFTTPPGIISGDRYDHATFVKQMKDAPRFDTVIEMIGYKPADAHSLVEAFAGRTDHLIFASTVDVYQKPYHNHPVTEDHPRGGVNDYGRNKVFCEDILFDAQRRGELNVTSIRLAYTYGEGGTWMVQGFANLGNPGVYFDRLLKGKTIISHGDGMSLWGATHIDDAATAFSGALRNPRAFGRAYNVTPDETMVFDDYHRTIARALGAPEPKFAHVPSDLLCDLYPEYGGNLVGNFMFDNCFDNSPAKRDLGYRYTIRLEDGMRRFAKWYVDKIGLKNSSDDPIHDRIIEAWTHLRQQMASRVKGS